MGLKQSKRLTRDTKEGIQGDSHVLDDETVCPVIDYGRVRIVQGYKPSSELTAFVL